MSSAPRDPETFPYASKLEELVAHQGVADDARWEQIASAAQSLADRLRTRDGEVDEHTALGQLPTFTQTLTTLFNEALATSTNPSGSPLSAVFQLLRTSANFCMDHDDNRQALLTAGFPQSIVALLHRYDAVQATESKPLPLSLMELKVIRTSAGVLLNASLHFDPVREYLVSAHVPELLIRLQLRVYPPGSWSVFENTQDPTSDIKEEWVWRSGFYNWASLTLSELLRGHGKPGLLSVGILGPLVTVLTAFTPPYPVPAGPLIEDATSRHSLISADVDILNDASSYLESLALDSEEIQVYLAQTVAHSSSQQDPGPLLKYMVDFVEHGDYPPYWAKELFSERAKRQQHFDLCKAALIKTVVEVTGATRCIDTLWDLSRPDGWFVSRMVNWIRTNPIGTREDLIICATLSLGNLARRESHCVALVQPPFSLVLELVSLLDTQADIKLKHGALGLLKHLAQSPTNRPILGEAKILEKLTRSQVWSEKTDMAETVQLSAIGTAKHLCTGNLMNAVQLAVSRDGESASSPTGIDQILALVKRSDTIAVKSEGTRVIVNVIKSLYTNSGDMIHPQRDEAMAAVTTSSAATALAELVGRSKKYPVLISEGLMALTLLSLQPSGGLPVTHALLAPLPVDPTPAPSRSVTSQSSQASPVSPPATCLTMLHNILTDIDGAYPAELRVNASSLLGSVGKKSSHEGRDATFLREHSGGILAALVHAQPTEVDDRVRKAAEKALEAWE